MGQCGRAQRVYVYVKLYLDALALQSPHHLPLLLVHGTLLLLRLLVLLLLLLLLEGEHGRVVACLLGGCVQAMSKAAERVTDPTAFEFEEEQPRRPPLAACS